MRPFRYALLAAAALAVTAACGRDVTAPGGPSVAGPFFTAIDTTADPDSVIGGYGCEPTGGLDYRCFEYEPCTGTEYVVTPDTLCEKREMETTEPRSLLSPTVTADTTPAPPPAPTPSPIVPQDSVIGGYGSGSTGGLEYDDFEYDPRTGTEYVATPDPDVDN